MNYVCCSRQIQIKIQRINLNQTILQDFITITGIWTHILNYKQDLYIYIFLTSQ